VVCDDNSVSNFDKLHTHNATTHQIVLYAFNLIELDGDD
jgi:hypothetical protein